MNKIKSAGTVIFIGLMLLIFFSSTIYNYNIPEVTAAIPKNGRLSKRETSSGVVYWADTHEMYFENGGKVAELFVKEGDFVTEGSLMARMSFDVEDIKLRLRQLEIDRDKISVAIETSELKIHKLQSQIDNLQAEVYEADTVSDYGIVQLESRLKKAQDACKKADDNYLQTQTLYEAGVVARVEFDSAAEAVQNALLELEAIELEYENAIEVKAENETKNAKAVDEKEKSRKMQIDDWKYEIDNMLKDIESKELEIAKSLEEQADYERILREYNDSINIYASRTGKLISLGADPVKAGQTVNKGQLFANIGLGSTFDITCSLSLANNFVAVGDECRISNTDHAYVAVVEKLEPGDNEKIVTVRISAEDITAGETFDIEFGKEAAKSAIIVPNGAVNKDSDNYFVYYIKKRKGILGDEYYAEKVPVYIGDSDDTNTIITQGITFFEPVIQLSDKPLSDGDTVRVRNESDLFVN